MAYKVAITGRFRTGKDTVATMLVKQLGSRYVTRIAFADALKYELADMVWKYLNQGADIPQLARDEGDKWYTFDGWMRMHREVNGAGWQWLGEFRRQFYGEDYWTNHPELKVRYAVALLQKQNIIITDMRHHNEAAWCREHGFFLVRVEGPCRAAFERRDANHPSERHVRDLDVHATIANTYGLSELGQAVRELYNKQIVPFFVGCK